MRIRSIIILGGGSSGWMTAAALSKNLPRNVEISLVESKKISTIGVGESTLGNINVFLRHYLNLKDSDWMKKCSATYKNSIRFTNFREPGSVFEYPFSSEQFNNTPNGLMDWCLADKFRCDWGPEKFAEMYFENSFLVKYNKCTKNEDGMINGFDFDNDTAYHMDASKFGDFLKEDIALPNGVQYYVDDIIDFVKYDDGSLDKLVGSSGNTYHADLFIDCTGFKSMILEEQMGSKFISYNDVLPNDSAVAVSIPYKDKESQMLNVTDCVASDSGWIWNIPLWNRIGCGYVYSSKFSTKENAEEYFKNYLRTLNDDVDLDSLQFNHIQIRHGRRESAWKKNVIGVGLSYGFVEPLESTGLVITHNNVMRLIDLFESRGMDVNSFDRSGFNLAAKEEIDGFRDFVAIHYAASSRRDTPYWKYVTDVVEYENDQFHEQMSQLHVDHQWKDDNRGINFILAGMGYNPLSRISMVAIEERFKQKKLSLETGIKNLSIQVDQRSKEVTDYVKKLPSHYQFLKETIYEE